MASLFRRAIERRLLADVPAFAAEGLQYEVILGSTAYGVSTDDSDLDLVGFCVPPKTQIFPHLRGAVPGYDPAPKLFEQVQEHHVHDASAAGGDGRTYDFNIYSIVKFFRLCAQNNPNMLDALFAPRRCVVYSTATGETVRERRHLFLHRGAWPRFKGYAYQQMHKIRTKAPTGRRREIVETYGWDVKFGYHIVRLLLQVEQLLAEGTMDLERHREQLKAIRRGAWSLDELERWVAAKEQDLERLSTRSDLPAQPRHDEIRALLLRCLERHWGELEMPSLDVDETTAALREVRDAIDRVRHRL
ncbi:MAG: nucleotidyltransferase domain-containing protein [Acidobacteriota bacterium]